MAKAAFILALVNLILLIVFGTIFFYMQNDLRKDTVLILQNRYDDLESKIYQVGQFADDVDDRVQLLER